MKLGKGKGKQIRRIIWNYFQPMYEHLGFENAKTIHQITNHVLKKVKVANDHKKDCPYFNELFTQAVSAIIHVTVLNPKLSKKTGKHHKLYLRGLLCETINESTGYPLGYYYFPKDRDEHQRIKELSRQKLTANEIVFQLRVIQGGTEHLKQLSHKESKRIK